MKRPLAIVNGILAAVFLLAPAAVFASPGSVTGPGAGGITTPGKTGPGDNNRGDTWLQTVGPCADHNAEVLNHNADAMSGCNLAVPGGNPEFEPPFEPTAENLQKAEIGTVEDVNPDHNPHLPCANIEVMGKDMGDNTGFYSIDYWPPTGNKGGVYGKNSNGSSALSLPGMINGDDDVTNNGAWQYSSTPTTASKQGKVGGYQVMDIIDVSALVHNAQLINPDPHDIQGYHFKLQFSQDPQKHKTFWVKCAAPSTPTPPPGPATGSVKGVTYFCSNGVQTAQPAPGTITIGSVSGNSPQTANDLTAGSQQVVNAQAGNGLELVACGGPTVVSPGCDVTGGMNGSGTATVPASGVATVCFYEQQPVVTPPPAHTGSVAGVTYYCENGQQTAHAAPGTITIGNVSGVSPQTATGLTSGTHQAVGAQPGSGLELVNCGAPSAVHAGCTVSGMNGTGTVTVPNNGTATVCFYEQQPVVTPPPANTGSVEGVTYYCQNGQQTTEAAPGTITIGSVSGSSPQTATGLAAGSQQTVTAQAGSGLELVNCGAPSTVSPGCAVSGMNGSGSVTVPNNDTAKVCFYEQHPVTTPPPATTACVGEEYMLQGTTIVIPGGTVSLTGQPNTSTPTVYCNLTPGQSVTGTSVQVPAGYTLVPGTQPITETLVPGNNPEMIFYLNLPQAQPQCGELLGTIVLAGTTTMVPGGTITETGTPTVTTYPSLLGGCQPAGQVPVSATAPAGYTFVGPSTTTVTIVNNKVTPVVFQVTPLSGGTLGSGTSPAQGSKPAAAGQGPLSGVLGAATMPLTGLDATKRIAVSLVCVALGLLSLASLRRLSRNS
jgi:hypothetical protein